MSSPVDLKDNKPVKHLRLSNLLSFYRDFGIVVAVIFTLIGSAFLTLVGAYQGVTTIIEFLHFKNVSDILSGLIKTMDIFLASLVMMLLAMGLHDLFMSHRDTQNKVCGAWMGFASTLDDLKESLAKLIVIILFISFFEMVLSSMDKFQSYEILIIPVGVILLAAGLRLTRKPGQ